MERTHVAEAARLVSDRAGKRIALQLAINAALTTMLLLDRAGSAVADDRGLRSRHGHWFNTLKFRDQGPIWQEIEVRKVPEGEPRRFLIC